MKRKKIFFFTKRFAISTLVLNHSQTIKLPLLKLLHSFFLAFIRSLFREGSTKKE